MKNALHCEIHIEIEGDTRDDMDTALQEVFRLIKDGYTLGWDANETSRFQFSANVTEREVTSPKLSAAGTSHST
jgi:hypothetical protein